MIITLSIMFLIALGLYIYQTIQLADTRKNLSRSQNLLEEEKETKNYLRNEVKKCERLLHSKKGEIKALNKFYKTEEDLRIKYEKALKTVDPNKLAIINQGHALGTAKLGFTQQGGVIQTKKHRSDYTTAGQVIDEALDSDWSVAK